MSNHEADRLAEQTAEAEIVNRAFDAFADVGDYANKVECVKAVISAIAGQQATGINGDWYCERHPGNLMGHEGCAGAGIIDEARIPQLLHMNRLLQQEVRETAAHRDDVVRQARALSKQQAPEATEQRQALAELVYCKDLKERIIALGYERRGDGATDGHPDLPELRREYDLRQPLAWAAARAALTAHEATAEPAAVPVDDVRWLLQQCMTHIIMRSPYADPLNDSKDGPLIEALDRALAAQGTQKAEAAVWINPLALASLKGDIDGAVYLHTDATKEPTDVPLYATPPKAEATQASAELPGMWERADFEGGETESTQAAAGGDLEGKVWRACIHASLDYKARDRVLDAFRKIITPPPPAQSPEEQPKQRYSTCHDYPFMRPDPEGRWVEYEAPAQPAPQGGETP